MRLPPRPDLTWKPDGTPVDTRVDDVYFSVEDGLAETRSVFLDGCGLPGGWAGRAQFTVAELGFGTGLNFLALWQLWQAHREPGAWLHFVSFEGYLLDREDAARALAQWPELAPLAARLVAAWPVRACGIQQFVWPEERVTLTLHIGEISERLPRADFHADAWFLDGFSPAKNEAMWGSGLWPLVAERCTPGARLATFTVAGAVRRGLTQAGFMVERLPGHGRKRHRLEVTWPGEVAPSSCAAPKRIAIIGAGIAGASLAHELVRRGAAVSVFDASDGPARATSGNPLALVMPRLDAADSAEAQLLIDAYLVALNTYRGLPGVDPVNVDHRPRDPRDEARFSKILADPPLGLDQLEALRGGGLLHKGALVLQPANLLPALLEGASLHWGREVTFDLHKRTVDGEAFDAVILAGGWHLREAFDWAGLNWRAGQVDWYESKVTTPPHAIAGGQYALANQTLRLWGATFDAHEGGPVPVRAEASADNLSGLEGLAPFWLQEARNSVPNARTGIRATTSDHLPLIGPVPDVPAMRETFAPFRDGQSVDAEIPLLDGVYMAGGFGSRGFTWGPYAAHVLAAEILASPSPLSRLARPLVAPARMVLRGLKRGRL